MRLIAEPLCLFLSWRLVRISMGRKVSLLVELQHIKDESWIKGKIILFNKTFLTPLFRRQHLWLITQLQLIEGMWRELRTQEKGTHGATKMWSFYIPVAVMHQKDQSTEEKKEYSKHCNILSNKIITKFYNVMNANLDILKDGKTKTKCEDLCWNWKRKKENQNRMPQRLTVLSNATSK